RGVAPHQRAADRPAEGGPRAAAVDVPAAARQVDRDRGAVDDEEARGGDEARRPRARYEERAGRGRLRPDHEGRGERHEPRGHEAILGERRPEAAEVTQLVARGDEEEERERRPQRGVDDGVHTKARRGGSRRGPARRPRAARRPSWRRGWSRWGAATPRRRAPGARPGW